MYWKILIVQKTKKAKTNFNASDFLFQDSNRLHYELWELQVFEHIECQWPMFFCLLLLDAVFQNDKDEVSMSKVANDSNDIKMVTLVVSI